MIPHVPVEDAPGWVRKTANAINGLIKASGSVASRIQYILSSTYTLRLGYDPDSDTAAAVKIGANDAGRGRGALQIGGAGQKDGGNGMFLTNDYSPAFSIFANSMKWGTTEVNIYGNNTGGIAVSTGTTTLTLTQGAPWDSKLIEKSLYFRGVPYTVNAVAGNGLSCTLASAPPAGTGAWNFALVTGSGTCSVSGTTVTRIVGEPFIFYGVGYTFKLNGSTKTVASSPDSDTIILSSAPGDTSSASYYYETSIASNNGPLLVGSRWQKVAGAQEEGVGMFVSSDGYRLGAFAAGGQGELYPFWLTSNYQEVIELHATGKYVSLGGKAGQEAMRAFWTASTVNRIEVTGGTTGNNPFMSARGSDTNINLAFDVAGTGYFDFTSGSFGRRNFRIYGSTGNDNLAVDASTGAPYLGAEGASANIDIRLIPKGTGSVWIGPWSSNADAAVNGYITVKDAAGNTRKLATIA